MESAVIHPTDTVVKLNLGCGLNKRPGYVNVDKFGSPDVQWDLETFPWPWPENSVDEIFMNHVLEHLGGTTEIYFGIIKELYRICKPEALIYIHVPHPRHDDFLNDPTHVRPITGSHLSLFSQRQNRYWQEMKAANSPLGLYLNVDFEVVHTDFILEEPWNTKFNTGEISLEEMNQALKQYNNVAKELRLSLKVIKPAGSFQ